jgi:hypothetical protein
MLNPIKNAEYAADFLASLHTELGSWEAAAGAYHSRTPKYADPYREKFSTFRTLFAAEDTKPIDLDNYRVATFPDVSLVQHPEAQSLERVPRVNTFPLLQKREGGAERGSLVPLGGGARGDFIDFGAS